jgi:hypothetical protein
MSLRYDRIDNFSFVLRHEIEHVLQKHGQVDAIGIVDELDGNRSAVDGPGLPREELIANRAAAEFCIPQHELVELIAQRNPYISERGSEFCQAGRCTPWSCSRTNPLSDRTLRFSTSILGKDSSVYLARRNY